MSVQRMGVVYRCYGDPTITEPIKNGMSTALVPQYFKELEAVKAENARLVKENRRLDAECGVKRAADAQNWPDVRDGLAKQYHIKQHGRIYNSLLVCWAMMWFEIGVAYERLSTWNRES